MPSEDSVAERRRKLEFLEMQEELIEVKFYTFCSVQRGRIVSMDMWHINREDII